MDKYVEHGADISCIDVNEEGKPIRNRWQWTWMAEISDDGNTYGSWCKKVKVSGTCFCVPCGKTVVYGSSGKKALKKHADLNDHVKAVRSVTNATSLHGATNTCEFTKGGVQDQQQEIKSILGLFISEHCLPFSLAPELLQLAKKLGHFTSALDTTAFSRQTATYTICHGVGNTIRDELKDKLKGTFVSLNVDEATNNAGNKFLNVLVQFYDEDSQSVKCQLLGTREVNLATADNITNAIGDILINMEMSWDQIVSVTMDNCSVMRGKKEGVEARMRALNTHLLDISGDTIHMLSNACKKFFISIDKAFDFQSLASDIFYDIEDSPKVRCLFGKIQTTLMKTKPKSIFRPIPNRFLQMHEVSARILDLWDCLTVYYFAFLDKKEIASHKPKIHNIYENKNLSESEMADLYSIIDKQRKQQKSDASNDRKDRIISALFDHEDKTLVFASLYKSMTEQFLWFTKKYQANKPQIHDLHTDMFHLVKEFYSGFIKPAKIPACSTFKLQALIPSEDNMLKHKDMSVGKYCKPFLNRCYKNKQKNNIWLPQFFAALKDAYKNATDSLKKLPLTNPTISELSYLSPSLQRNENTANAICSLAQRLPNVINEADIGFLDSEVRAYTVDESLSMLEIDVIDENFRLDKDWWNEVFIRKNNGSTKYSVLSKLVKSAMSIFSGPLVEGSFNIMDDILEDDRNKLTTFNFESLALIKSSLKANGEKAVTKKITQKMKRDVGHAYSKYQEHSKDCVNSYAHFSKSVTTCNEASSSGPVITSTAAAAVASTSTSTAAAAATGTSSSLKSAPSATPNRKRRPYDVPSMSITKFFKKM